MKAKVREILNRDRSEPCLALTPRAEKRPEPEPEPARVERPSEPAPRERSKKPKRVNPVSVFWTAEQVAEYLGLEAHTVYNGGAGLRQLPRVRLGRSVRWKRTDVEAFAERKHQQAVARLAGRRRFPSAVS
jgi:excisionase family DNA binding protein